MKRALIVVDVQNDFCPGGALAVKDGADVVQVANKLMTSDCVDVIVLTQDWHPADHKSFASNNPGSDVMSLGSLNGVPQVMWPDHCVKSSYGSKLYAGLSAEYADSIIRKGTRSWVDSYSGFFDNVAVINGKEVREPTGLEGYLKSQGIEEVYVCGLATDYCVKYTALDSVKCGFKTRLVLDGCRAVNLRPGDDLLAVEEMRKVGVVITDSQNILV